MSSTLGLAAARTEPQPTVAELNDLMLAETQAAMSSFYFDTASNQEQAHGQIEPVQEQEEVSFQDDRRQSPQALRGVSTQRKSNKTKGG